MSKKLFLIMACALLTFIVGTMPADAQKLKEKKAKSEQKDSKITEKGKANDDAPSFKPGKAVPDGSGEVVDDEGGEPKLPSVVNNDTVPMKRLEMRGDTIVENIFLADTTQRAKEDVFDIMLLTRGYEDRIVLRWAPKDYAAWRFLNRYGYRIIRADYNGDELIIDTLVHCLKPLSVEQFRQKYDPNDSIVGIAVETMYGTPTSSSQPTNQRGTLGNLIERYDEQQSYYSMGMMAAEMNIGIAHDMALAYTDRSVVKGNTYYYRIEALVPKEVMYFNPAGNNVEVKAYEPQPYFVHFSDSITPPGSVTLMWPRDAYYAHDIERRLLSDTTANAKAGEWQRLNDHPYVYMSTDQVTDDSGELYLDRGLKPGVYEYRLKGYDTFGDKTLPSNTIRVRVGDMTPPRAPMIDLFEILRPDDKIYCKITFHKDTTEADFTGYRVLYYNKNVFDDWQQLGDDLPASATEATVDVTDLPTGLVCVAALDSAGNMGPSVPQSMRIGDLTPPSVPQNLRANVAPDGLVVLRWTACPERDVDYYELQFANELAEGFTTLTTVHQDTLYCDSISVTVNQRFIYYRIRAIDYATNAGDYSQPIEVLRPHFQPPLVCRLDTAWVSGNRINMRWVQSNEADLSHHRLFRRLETQDTWELIATFNADSIRYYGNDFIYYTDEVKPNYAHDYLYVMDTWNLSNFSSGLSKIHNFAVMAHRTVDVKISLQGNYDKQAGESRLAWTTGTMPNDVPYYYCVYRREKGQRSFRYLTSVEDQPAWSDRLTRTGETAEYYVKIQFEDGRDSTPSNIITIKAPEKQQ